MGGYIGRGQPVAAGGNSVETADIIDDAVTNAKIATNAVTGDSIASNAVGNSELSDDAVGVAELSATGTAGNTTFLRGDNSWQTAGSTSASDLTSGTLPIARIADGAVTAAKVAADVATQAELDTVSTVASAALPKAGGTMTGDIAHAGNFTINTDGNIALDNGSNNIVLLKDGAQYGLLTASSGNLVIKSGATTAITFANAAANFASTITAVGNITANGNLVTTNDVIFGANANGLAEEDGTIVRYKNTHSGGVLHLMTHDGNEDIEINPSGWMRFETAGSERMRITDNGTIGIGNTIPNTFNSQANLLVVGTGSGDNGITIYSGSGTGDSGNLFFADGAGASDETRGGISYQHETNQMQFRVNDANRMEITSAGKVGIGTASPLYALHVNGTGIGGRIMMEDTANSTTGIFMKVSNSGTQVANSTIRQENNGDITIYQGTTSEAVKLKFLVGGGIAFNGDTAAANALDDYEEGTFTPVYTVVGGGSHSSVSANNYGVYTKVGRMCTIGIESYIVQTTGTITYLNVNLPFTAASGGAAFTSMGDEFGQTGMGQQLKITSGGTVMSIKEYDGTPPSHNGYFSLGITYQTA